MIKAKNVKKHIVDNEERAAHNAAHQERAAKLQARKGAYCWAVRATEVPAGWINSKEMKPLWRAEATYVVKPVPVKKAKAADADQGVVKDAES